MTGACPQSRGSGQRCSADELHRKSDARRDLCPLSADGLGSGFSLTTRNASSLRIVGSGSRTRWTAWSQVKRTAGAPRQGCSNIRCSPPAQGRRQRLLPLPAESDERHGRAGAVRTGRGWSIVRQCVFWSPLVLYKPFRPMQPPHFLASVLRVVSLKFS